MQESICGYEDPIGPDISSVLLVLTRHITMLLFTCGKKFSCHRFSHKLGNVILQRNPYKNEVIICCKFECFVVGIVCSLIRTQGCWNTTRLYSKVI